MLLQSVNFRGDQFLSLRKGFRPLVNYIGVKQRDGTKISVAAPVMRAFGNDEEGWIISFSMPSKYTKTNLPKPRVKSLFTQVIVLYSSMRSDIFIKSSSFSPAFFK